MGSVRKFDLTNCNLHFGHMPNSPDFTRNWGVPLRYLHFSILKSTHVRPHEPQAGGKKPGDQTALNILVLLPNRTGSLSFIVLHYCLLCMECDRLLCLGFALLPSFGVFSGNMYVPVSWQFALGVLPVLLCWWWLRPTAVPSSALFLCGLLLQKELCMELCMEDPPAKKNCNKTTYIFYIFVLSVQKMLMMQPAAGSIIQLDGWRLTCFGRHFLEMPHLTMRDVVVSRN